MTMRDPFAQPDRGHAPLVRWRRTWAAFRAWARRAGGERWHGRHRHDTDLLGPAPRMRLRTRIRLSALESALARDTPRLASMFNLFNQLAGDEPPRSPERVLAPARHRFQPVPVVALVTLAVVAALCFALSTQVGPVTRQCTTPATAAATVTATGAATAASQNPAAGQPPTASTSKTGPGARTVGAVVRGLNCAAYPTSK
jgi:hypothetical protein